MQQEMLQPVHRGFEEADIEQILELQNRVFETKRTRADWNWKSVDNPYLQNAGVVGLVGEKVVSSYTIVGMKLNMLGSPVLVGHSTDTVIDIEFRKRGYFRFLFDYAMRHGERLGAQAAIGFPNEQAIRTNLQQARIDPIVVMKAYSQRLCFPRKSISRSLTHALLVLAFKTWIWSRLQTRFYRHRLAVGNAVRVVISSELPNQYQELWNGVRKREIVSVWKDSEYMNWRYAKNPRTKAEYCCAYKDNKLCGIAVFVKRDHITYITELIMRDVDVALGRLLIDEILQHCLNSGVEIVKFYGHDRGFFELVFSEFMRQPAEDIVFIGQIYNDLLKELCRQPLNVCLTTGDADVSW